MLCTLTSQASHLSAHILLVSKRSNELIGRIRDRGHGEWFLREHGVAIELNRDTHLFEVIHDLVEAFDKVRRGC